MKISEIKPNPNNPRVIKDAAFEKLCKSIQEFPKMMSLRPLVIDSDMIVLGGNMRLKALQHLGYKEIPDEWVKRADELNEDEKRRFIIADNISGGEWDWDTLANEWDAEELEAWGLEVFNDEDLIKKTINLEGYQQSHVLISYHPDLHNIVQEIIKKLQEVEGIEIELSAN